MIFHLTEPAQWAFWENRDVYLPAFFGAEGFVHCSTEAQMAASIERHFKGIEAILVLKIDENKLLSPLKWELAPSVGEAFPHVFGPIQKSAIVAVERVR